MDALPERRARTAVTHVPELDGVRGVAIAAVMIMHFIAGLVGEPQNLFEKVAAAVTGYGMWGVDLFFVLSGYLITGILWDSRPSTRYFRVFYMRRLLRIFPLYYGVLFVLVVLIPRSVFLAYDPDALRIRDVQAWLWTYLTNVYVAKEGSFAIPYVSHFWTLAIEEHFYMVWPFVIRFVSRRAAMTTAIALSALALTLRLTLAFLPVNELWAHVLTPCRLDALCIGAYLALAIRGPDGAGPSGVRVQRWVLPALAVLVVLVVLPMGEQLRRVTLPLKELLMALIFGGAVLLSAWSDGPKVLKVPLRWGWLRWLGKYSYGLYVFHVMIVYAFASHHTIDYFQGLVGSHTLALLVQAVIGTLLSLLVAVLSYHLYEVHFLRLKRLFKV